MKNFISILSFTILLFALSSCEENNDPKNIEGEVDIYLLQSYEKMDNTIQINEGSIVIEDSPIIPYADLIAYNKAEYAFEISDSKKQAIQDLEVPLDGRAFAVIANGVLVYTGYFWPSYLSSICNWIVIDPLFMDSSNKLFVKLGYPDQLVGESIPDKRNDSKIIDIFKRDDKLIE